jgi:4'-phosphopantetheinyl transferase
LTPYPWPQASEVHIHCVSLTDETTRYVSPEELIRADRLRIPRKRNFFIACRGLLREILGRYLQKKPEEIFFATGEHGKPYLVSDTVDSSQLHFNLSHSTGLFLLAIAAGREVGIDVEIVRNNSPFHDMARLAFSLREQEKLFALPDNLQRTAFYRYWTRKEAYMKGCGMGFALQPNSFDVTLSRDTIVLLNKPSDISDWILHEIAVPEGYCAALAIKGAATIIHCID